jgi:hypothetical protein
MSPIRVASGILLILYFVIQGLWLSALMAPGLMRAAAIGTDPDSRSEARWPRGSSTSARGGRS